MRSVFPDIFQLPEIGGFAVWLYHADEPDTHQMIQSSCPHPEHRLSPGSPWTDRTCDLVALATGRYRIEFWVRDQSPGAVQSGTIQPSAKGSIEVRQGERSTFKIERL